MCDEKLENRIIEKDKEGTRIISFAIDLALNFSFEKKRKRKKFMYQTSSSIGNLQNDLGYLFVCLSLAAAECSRYLSFPFLFDK